VSRSASYPRVGCTPYRSIRLSAQLTHQCVQQNDPRREACVDLGFLPSTNMSNPSSDHRTSRRMASLTAVTLTVMASTVTLAPATNAAAPAPPVQNTKAAIAVTQLTSAAGPPVPIPTDFAAVSGYTPVQVDGVLVNPNGDCSAPVPLPPEFDTACKAHDLGYDLLRYAAHGGAPLQPWARQAIDRNLDQRMQQACTERTEPLAQTHCQAMAEVAATAVDLNSRRQGYGVPVVESFFGGSVQEAPSHSWLLLGVVVTMLAGLLVLGSSRARSQVRRTVAIGPMSHLLRWLDMVRFWFTAVRHANRHPESPHQRPALAYAPATASEH